MTPAGERFLWRTRDKRLVWEVAKAVIWVRIVLALLYALGWLLLAGACALLAFVTATAERRNHPPGVAVHAPLELQPKGSLTHASQRH